MEAAMVVAMGMSNNEGNMDNCNRDINNDNGDNDKGDHVITGNRKGNINDINGDDNDGNANLSLNKDNYNGDCSRKYNGDFDKGRRRHL